MDHVNINAVSHKSLKVKKIEPKLDNEYAMTSEEFYAEIEPVTEKSDSIQAEKAVRLTKKGKPFAERKINTEGLKKGREKLALVNAEKRIKKSLLINEAVEKRVQKEIKMKQEINKTYGIDSDDEVESVEPIVAVKKVAVAPVIKKKKPIKYIEIDSSSEEEIVYVKRQKAVVAPKRVAKKMIVADEPPIPRIIFY